ncbi:hypothetical protein J4474_03070 [Candidatus Pacearchaeota archaeon]|nr:hypothetical protein [Candidatus Pacearchaeota archaeon]
MLKNKKGVSEAVMTVIMIVLILVAIGVIWLVVQGVLSRGSSTADYSTKCLGIAIVPTALDPTAKTVSIEREATSVSTPVDGIEVTLGDTNTNPKVVREGDIVASTKVPVPNAPINSIQATVRAYFNDTKTGEAHYCNIAVYPQ